MEPITIPELTNPRLSAEFDNWPFGRNKVRCQFEVETGKRGQRVLRRTENKTRTGWNADKKTTYYPKWRIVDGADGKTYLISITSSICVWSSNMQHSLKTYYDCETYEKLLLLFN